MVDEVMTSYLFRTLMLSVGQLNICSYAHWICPPGVPMGGKFIVLMELLPVVVFTSLTVDSRQMLVNFSLLSVEFVAGQMLVVNRLQQWWRSIVMSTSVYVCVCLPANISPKPHVQSLPNFSCMLPFAVAQYSTSGVMQSQGKGQFCQFSSLLKMHCMGHIAV